MAAIKHANCYPCRAVTRFGSDWPSWQAGRPAQRVEPNIEVIARHAAADQDGWDGGIVCQTNNGRLVIEESALKLKK